MDYSKMIYDKKNKKIRNPWFDNHIKSLSGLSFEPNTNDGKKGLEDFLVGLTTNNLQIIKGDICKNINYNSNYSFDVIVFNHFGGANYFATGNAKKEELYTVLRCIDFVNSTQAWKNKVGFNALVDFIMKQLDPTDPDSWFWNRVKEYDDDLVDYMTSLSKSKSKSSLGLRSFASKICRFFNREAFLRDDYYAWDNVVLKQIEYYWKYYVKKPAFKQPKTYKELYVIMDNIRDKGCSEMKRFELDQIIWYCYRWG